MRYILFLALSLLFTSTTLYALPGPLELEIVESRGYIDVPISLLQIRTDTDDDQLGRRQDSEEEIVHLHIRDGGQIKKAGDILDKVGKGLSAASAVPVLGSVSFTFTHSHPLVAHVS